MVSKALVEIGELIAQMYGDDIKGGRPGIAPEKRLLRATLLEQTQYNRLFLWFIGLSMDEWYGCLRCSPRTANG